MPNLNRKGQALMGVGSGPASVDSRVIITPGGGGSWLDDDNVIVQTKIGNIWQLVTIRISDGHITPIMPLRAANSVCAGGGRWLAWLSGTGMYGSLGDKPLANLIAAGSDGTLAWCPSYSTGVGLVLTAPNGSETVVPDANIVNGQLQVLGPDSALWLDFNGPRVVGRAPLKPALKSGRMCLVTLGLEEWLVYWCDLGLVAQLNGATDGYVLEPNPVAFNHDAINVNGELIVAWSRTQGERPGDLVRTVVNRQAIRMPLKLPVPIPKPKDIPKGGSVSPKITVNSFATRLKKGEAATLLDMKVGETNITVSFDSNGNLKIHSKSPTGEDTTGAIRHVEIG